MDKTQLDDLTDKLVDAYRSALEVLTGKIEEALEEAAKIWGVDETKKADEPETERVDWVDVFAEQRRLAAYPDMHVMGVRWVGGDLWYTGDPLEPIAKVHDPKIGCDGSNTVLVVKR